MKIFFCLKVLCLSLLVSSLVLAEDVVIHSQNVDLTRQRILTEFAAQSQDVQDKLKENEMELKKFIDALYNEFAFEYELNKLNLKDNPKVAQKIQIAIRKVLIDEFVAQKKQSIVIPEMEPLALAEYEAHPEKFVDPEFVQAKHILIKFDGTNKADKLKLIESLKKRIEKGESFAELAKQYSEDKASAIKGGELGAFQRKQMVKPFEDGAFALKKPGQLSNIVETQFGFHLIQLDVYTPSKQQEFAVVKAELMAEMEQEYLKNEIRTWREAIIDPKKASLNQAELDKVIADIKAIK